MSTPSPEHAAAFTTILSWQEAEAVEDAQQRIVLRSRLLCYVLEKYCDEPWRDALQELAHDIEGAAAAIEAVLVRARANGRLRLQPPRALAPSPTPFHKAEATIVP